MANTTYATGTISLTNGFAVVTGTGTGWQTALIAGGVIYPEAAGNPLPFDGDGVTSNTSITAKTKWTGATGTYAYGIARQDDVNQVLRNAQALSTYLTRLDNDALAALAGLDPQADRMAYFTGDAAAALATITSKARELLDDADASAMLSTLGVSAFIKTLLDDANQAAALVTLGAQSSLGFTPVQQGGGTLQGPNKVRLGWSTNSTGLRAQVDDLDLGRVWTDQQGTRSLATNGHQRIPGGIIVQWGALSNSLADYTALFPTSFPTACIGLSLINTYEYDGSTTSFIAASTGGITASQFNVRTRRMENGLTSPVGGVPLRFIAVGY